MIYFNINMYLFLSVSKNNILIFIKNFDQKLILDAISEEYEVDQAWDHFWNSDFNSNKVILIFLLVYWSKAINDL